MTALLIFAAVLALLAWAWQPQPYATLDELAQARREAAWRLERHAAERAAEFAAERERRRESEKVKGYIRPFRAEGR